MVVLSQCIKMLRSAGHPLVLTVICLPGVSVSIVFSARLSMKAHREYLMTPVALATDSGFKGMEKKKGVAEGLRRA